MEDHIISQAKEYALFNGISDSEMSGIWHFATPVLKNYEKGEIITGQGEVIHGTGLVLDGVVTGICYHDDGEMQLIGVFRKGDCIDLKGITSGKAVADLTFQAKTATSVLFINFNTILQSAYLTSRCKFALLGNLSVLLAEGYSKAINICQILFHYKIRDRIICFLEMVRNTQDTDTIDVFMTQSEMAQLLGVNRSVLSKELNAMRREGIIDFSDSTYILKK